MPDVKFLNFECVNGCGRITETDTKAIFAIWRTGIIQCPICKQRVMLTIDGKYRKI